MTIMNGIYLIYNDEYAIHMFNGKQTKKVYLCLFKNDKGKWKDTDIYKVYPQDYFDDFIVVLNNEVEKLIKMYEKGDVE